MDNETFTYWFDLDRDYFIDFSASYQSFLPFINLLTLRPLIFLILMRKRGHMTTDIRRGYIMNQVAQIVQEFNFCFLFRVHDLAPYAGLYCDGPLCRKGIDKPYLLLLLSLTTIGSVPTFLMLLIRMHQRIIDLTDSKLKLTTKVQTVKLIGFTAVLVINVPGFYHFGRDCTNADEMSEASGKHIPDLAWLKHRGGTLFLFGPPGHSEFFNYELLMLMCSILVILPFTVITSLHAMKVMYEQQSRKSFTSRTQRLQLRLARVFFLQIVAVICFYVMPLFAMLLHMVVDVTFLPIWFIVLCRWGLFICFTLEGTLLSLIFLLKNPDHRQIIKEALNHLFTGNKKSSVLSATIKISSNRKQQQQD